MVTPGSAQDARKGKIKIKSVNDTAVGAQLHRTTWETQKWPGGGQMVTPRSAQDARKGKNKNKSVNDTAMREQLHHTTYEA